MTSAYDHVTYHGHTLNRRTKAMLQQVEAYLGYELTILQGSYHRGVGASAGTHDGGGAVDLAPAHQEDKVEALRQVGFAAWHRTPIPNVWEEHIHCIAINDKQVSSAARSQIQDYYAHLNGLAGHAHDSSWRPNHIVPFQYPPSVVDLSNVQEQAHHATHKLAGVQRVQKALNLKTGAGLAQDGMFGPTTKAAYKRYEKQIGSPTADGVPSKPGLIRLGLATYNVKG